MNYGYKKMYIGGQMVDAISGAKKDVINPALEESVGSIAYAQKEDAELALLEAQKGFTIWSKMPLTERTEWMMKLRAAILERADDLQKAVMYEMGKTYDGAAEDIQLLADGLEFYPQAMKNMHDEIIPDSENTHRHQIVNLPVGVAVAYLAWNFPLLNVGYKIGPALAAGCSIIVKPSELSPISAYLVGEIAHSIGFPAGVLNIISGPVSEVATTMTKSPIPKVLTMIGSSTSGKRVIADSATTVKHVSLELGGNAPYIVHKDADLDLATNIGVALKYGNTGQICVSPNRFIIHEDIYDDFLALFKEKASKLKIGFGIENKPDMGPLVTKKDQERVLKMVADDVASGAELVLGGKVPDGFSKGYYMEPTILSGITRD
ncbi:MAG: aldehyde dehydrogenase family protein, partial [Bacteroidales bacterium]|nr:aldehyde dehydrogenase family protein [Bacteroidales bacterium]